MKVIDETEAAEMQGNELRFFYWVGNAVTFYQQCEDYLWNVFFTAMGGSEEIARAIFATAQGLPRKMELITAAVSKKPELRISEWSRLRGRMTRAADDRNQIAHGTPTWGGRTYIIERAVGDCPPKVYVEGDSRYLLVKRTKAGEKIWEVDDIQEAYLRFRTLFASLIAFVQLLRGETPPPLLLDDQNG